MKTRTVVPRSGGVPRRRERAPVRRPGAPPGHDGRWQRRRGRRRGRDACAGSCGSSPARSGTACVELRALRGGQDVASAAPCGGPPATLVPGTPPGEGRTARLPHRRPRLRRSPSERAGEDLGALRIEDPDHPDEVLVAAGAPWYMTLFGRDSILTSWMALPLDPEMALGTASALARLQGREDVAGHRGAARPDPSRGPLGSRRRLARVGRRRHLLRVDRRHAVVRDARRTSYGGGARRPNA